jgi:hypothetical protein
VQLQSSQTDKQLTLSFYVPILTISSFNQNLDFEMGGTRFTLLLPVGAVNDLEQFQRRVNEEFDRLVGDQVIRLHISSSNRRFCFRSDAAPFRLLFAGVRSCCYLLGFAAKDTAPAYAHEGEALFTNIALNVSIEAVNLVVSHLLYLLGVPNEVSHFNEDVIHQPSDTVHLPFEQFRVLYVNFFSDGDRLSRLRSYASSHYRRFNFKVHFNRTMRDKYERFLRREDKKGDAELILQRGLVKETYNHDPDGGLRKRRAGVVSKKRAMVGGQLLSWVRRREARLLRRKEKRQQDIDALAQQSAATAG